MAVERDFNDILDDIVLSEEREHKDSYAEGYTAGRESGNPEGYHIGYHRGAELGRELGYYQGIITFHIKQHQESDSKYSDKLLLQLTKVKELIDTFPRSNSEDHDILGMLETVRAQYKKTCALLKIPSNNPYNAKFIEPAMKSTISKLQHHIDSITSYLTPLLPITNCHMVEFLTANHWERLMPSTLRKMLDGVELNDSLDKFWNSTCGEGNKESSELSKWIHEARAHYVTVNNVYCLSTSQLQERIKAWGGELKPEIRINEFMSSKKSYEVQTMSRLVASLHSASASTCCVEAGGGRGHLPVALSLGYNVPSLTVDCDENTVKTAAERVKIIQKQWHAIAKRIKDGNEEAISDGINKSLHRFASSFITRHTDLAAVVQDKFPEYSGDVRLLLTGLHTCGNLGPDCLRIFTAQPSTAAVFNVPCCYHHLTEDIDVGFVDVFQKEYGAGQEMGQGFPMSGYLRGYNLGRNARMLAAQSIDRVISERTVPSRSLLYRALLQEVIKEHLPSHKISEGKLKRITHKCHNFEQYFKMADAILNLDIFDSLPASVHTDINKNIDCQWKRLVMFYLLRLCLAQVVESLILLDRLMFLFENGFDKVYLVKLFDPVLSPRCHSIVAVR